jgi:DNA-binding Lrp family transcriptional regulator
MTVLDRVVAEMGSAQGPIPLSEIAKRVGVSRSALDGMLGVLVDKGRLTSAGSDPIPTGFACTGAACGTTCVGLEDCPFVAEVGVSWVASREPRAGGS